MTLKLVMQHRVLEFYHVYSNDDPGLTYFTARGNLVPYAFVWEQGKTVDFSETIVVYDLNVNTQFFFSTNSGAAVLTSSYGQRPIKL